ncbi:MAG: hypothetical protein RBU23_07635 [Candidatus Auribacterota bacterium]|jgi:hypothetical protein|nr:hypothetical protein [Candidatus Auribacterota bacterium]
MKKILVLLILFTFTTISANAKLSISPVRIENSLPAGKSFEGYYILSNLGDNTISVEISLTTSDNKNTDWINFNSNLVTVEPKSKAEAKFTIHIPESASGVLIARINFYEKPVDTSGSPITFTISSPIYISIKGTEIYKANIQNISILNSPKTSFLINIANTGNVHIRPKGNIVIQKTEPPVPEYAEEYKIIFNQSQSVVLPGATRDLIGSFDDQINLPDGSYKASINIEYKENDWISEEIIFEVDGGIAIIR